MVPMVVQFGNRQILMENALHSFYVEGEPPYFMEIWKKWEPLLSLPAWKSCTQPLKRFYTATVQELIFCAKQSHGNPAVGKKANLVFHLEMISPLLPVAKPKLARGSDR